MSEEKKSKVKEDLKQEAKLFHRLAGYYKWSWQDYQNTPRWLLYMLCEILDEPGEDLSKFIGYEEYCEYRNLLRLHGAKESNND